ncbi:MAG: CBS domain-containing protein [Desulfomonilaceae bacterium]
MFVRNWMHPQELSISSDALAVTAVTLISEHKLKMLPVVDNGRLRGVVHRRDLSEAATCVSESGNSCEMNYFCNKLKVKDVMVRMPATVSVDDSVEDVLTKGRELTMSTFPVMDGDKVVGVLSDREIFVMLYKLLEVGTDCVRITLSDVNLQEGTLSKILKIVEESSCMVRAVFTVPEGKNGVARVVLRTDCQDPECLRRNLQDNGFNILEFKG